MYNSKTISNNMLSDWSWRSPAYAWWVVVVLALGLTLSLMDRMIIALMIEPIKRDLSLSDVQVSLVHGMAFTLTYVFAGLALGRVADQGNRRWLCMASVVFWSVMTALCGGATSFNLLFAARLGIGIGEAGISPAAFSLVNDYFPQSKRAKPLAFLTIGTTAGAGIALMVGGTIIQTIANSKGYILPVFGRVHTWQAVFIVLGIVGIGFAGLFFTVREPERRETLGATAPSVGDLMQFVIARRAFFMPQFFGPALAVLVLIAFHSWMPAMLMRRFHWSIGQAGLSYGALITFAGCIGIFLSGRISEIMTERGIADAPQRVALFAVMAAAPILGLAPLLPNATFVLMALFPGLALVTIPSTLAPAAFQAVVPNEMRGQVFVLYLFVLSFLGYALGPLAVALVTQNLFGNDLSVHLSLALVAATVLPVSALCLGAVRRASTGFAVQ
jgi:MFS family permease